MLLDGQLWTDMGKMASDRLSINWLVHCSSGDPKEKDAKREKTQSQTMTFLIPTTILDPVISETF